MKVLKAVSHASFMVCYSKTVKQLPYPLQPSNCRKATASGQDVVRVLTLAAIEGTTSHL